MMLALHGARPIPEARPSKTHWGKRRLARAGQSRRAARESAQAGCGKIYRNQSAKMGLNLTMALPYRRNQLPESKNKGI
jgi:hypothetical protein